MSLQPDHSEKAHGREAGSRVLIAFDYGARRIGVATGQEITRTATALTTLQAVDRKPDWDAITRIIEEWKPDALVIGVPYHMDGDEHEMTRAARKFGRQLEGRYHLPVYEMDERLSSHAAEEELTARRSAGRKRKTRKEEIDSLAAQIILENWLQQES
jgi:putative Holliday junction resolvase